MRSNPIWEGRGVLDTVHRGKRPLFSEFGGAEFLWKGGSDVISVGLEGIPSDTGFKWERDMLGAIRG